MVELGPVEVVSKPRWRHRDDGLVELWYEAYDRWQALLPWTGSVLEALERGSDAAELLEVAKAHSPGKDPERRLRSFLFSLSVNGYVRLPGDDPPDVYDGRFERVRELGRGGVSILDLCRDRADGTEVVVKRAWDYLVPMAHADGSVRNEADVLPSLDHPGVVSFVHAFERDDRLHLVRSFVDGADVLFRLGYVGAKDARQAALLARSVGRIVEHLHERGFLLLDLHPGNFLARRLRAGDLILIDVGHAQRMLDGRAQLRTPAGTRAFAAPEVRRDRVADVRSDVYSLGRFLFFVATGIIPRARWNASELHDRVTDPVLSAAVHAMTRQDPQLRPATIAEALVLLEDIGPPPS
ncbi:MAG TPA: protein kinase [Candidatus Thermoplasmatota archaeon]